MNEFDEAVKSAEKCDVITLRYFRYSDTADSEILAHNIDAIAAMLGALIQTVIRQKYLSPWGIFKILLKARK